MATAAFAVKRASGISPFRVRRKHPDEARCAVILLFRRNFRQDGFCRQCSRNEDDFSLPVSGDTVSLAIELFDGQLDQFVRYGFHRSPFFPDKRGGP